MGSTLEIVASIWSLVQNQSSRDGQVVRATPVLPCAVSELVKDPKGHNEGCSVKYDVAVDQTRSRGSRSQDTIKLTLL